jgi:holo-[acyl-carrier protein] synthase
VIRGIGVDVVAVSRMRRWVDDDSLMRYFADQEREAIYQRRDEPPSPWLPVSPQRRRSRRRWARAFRGFGLRDVWVVNDALGKPELHVSGPASRALARLGGSRLWLSLTHEQEHAIAMVVIEG